MKLPYIILFILFLIGGWFFVVKPHQDKSREIIDRLEQEKQFWKNEYEATLKANKTYERTAEIHNGWVEDEKVKCQRITIKNINE